MGLTTVTSSISSLRSMAPTSTPLRKPKIWVTTDTPGGMINIKMIVVVMMMLILMITMIIMMVVVMLRIANVMIKQKQFVNTSILIVVSAIGC